MKKPHGFTLVELLVVISIIALLMSILMPALARVRDLGRQVVCMSNARTLIQAWMMYAEANDDKLPYAETGAGGWIDNAAANTLAAKLKAIRDGTLYPYLKNVKPYHCPGDRRKIVANQLAWGSYSIACGMNGSPSWYDAAVIAAKLTMVKVPANKYVFVEEADPRGWNWGSWVMRLFEASWIDPVANWHRGKSTLSFADGHCQVIRWLDKRTIQYAEDPGTPWFSGTTNPVQPNNPDIRYMQEGGKAAR